MKNSQFYNSLSADYDEMINFNQSLINKQDSLKNFIRPHYYAALDFGCGSGADSIALSKLGLNVDAIDHSKGMIEQAKLNAKKRNVKINFTQSCIEDLKIEKKYDLVVSLGNTIANINVEQLEILFSNLNKCVNQNGSVLFQLINFKKLPKSGLYILSEFENDSLSIIRKYEIHSSIINFIIEKKEKSSNERRELVTKIYPHSLTMFNELAKNYDYTIREFGSLKKNPYQPNKSNNLVVLLTK